MDDWLIIEKIEDVVAGTSIPYNYDKSGFQEKNDIAICNYCRGYKKGSDDYLHLYIYKGNFKRDVNTNKIVKKDFENILIELQL